jgi:hypothetical protein
VAVFPFLHESAGERFAPVREKITGSCQEDGIRAIDLVAAFEGHQGENLTVNAFDAHPTEQAHKLVADLLAEKIDLVLPPVPGEFEK